ncbi:MAG: tRNA (adenosine(37)-N6)-threonylcarbamoyltransferase complex dimerization subunit type 1 TsaB [Verrucomicrobiota bacterium]|jgi:tRNA threonylcarbamoyladenosine biosynthesis protein TsaB
MKILAVEFSSEQRSVALMEDDASAAPVLAGRAAEISGRRALGLVEEALQQAGWQREEIQTLAVGLGPGSYTGIRGAIALAQGWQLGRGVNLLGISSVECLAAQAEAEKMFGPVHIVVDAQRNEFYLAGYEIAPGRRHEAQPLRLAGLAEIQRLADAGARIIGPEAAQWFPQAATVFPDAAVLARLACGRRDYVPGGKLEPIYMRQTTFKKAPPLRVVT